MVADASVWASIVLPRDAFNVRSRAWLQDVSDANEEILAPSLLLSEVAGAVSRRSGDDALGLDSISWLTQQVPVLTFVPVDQELGVLAAEMAAMLRLRGADAIYVALAHEVNAPLVSWDAEQIERGGRLVAARTP
jgi:predicted nucleic acid-binding protein